MFNVTSRALGSIHHNTQRLEASAQRTARVVDLHNNESADALAPPASPGPSRGDLDAARRRQAAVDLAAEVAEQIQTRASTAADVTVIRSEDERLGRLLDLLA